MIALWQVKVIAFGGAAVGRLTTAVLQRAAKQLVFQLSSTQVVALLTLRFHPFRISHFPFQIASSIISADVTFEAACGSPIQGWFHFGCLQTMSIVGIADSLPIVNAADRRVCRRLGDVLSCVPCLRLVV